METVKDENIGIVMKTIKEEHMGIAIKTLQNENMGDLKENDLRLKHGMTGNENIRESPWK